MLYLRDSLLAEAQRVKAKKEKLDKKRKTVSKVQHVIALYFIYFGIFIVCCLLWWIYIVDHGFMSFFLLTNVSLLEC